MGCGAGGQAAWARRRPGSRSATAIAVAVAVALLASLGLFLAASKRTMTQRAIATVPGAFDRPAFTDCSDSIGTGGRVGFSL